MHVSLIIAAHNEGANLHRTVASCVEAGFGADGLGEIVVVDDASTDGSTAGLEALFEPIRVDRSPERLGVSITKDRGARLSRGEVLIFLDGHCKPEPGSLQRLVTGVDTWDGHAIVTPAVAVLDASSWQNDLDAIGYASSLDLDSLTRRWADLTVLEYREHHARGRYYESPSLVGCALAVTRTTYERIGGFDRSMRIWGVEDIDFGLKAWLLGHPILHDPEAVIGHRFQNLFAYEVSAGNVVGNTLRMARKVFDPPTWDAWVAHYRQRLAQDDFNAGWAEFEAEIESANRERDDLRTRADHDVRWFVDKFQLPFPLAG